MRCFGNGCMGDWRRSGRSKMVTAEVCYRRSEQGLDSPSNKSPCSAYLTEKNCSTIFIVSVFPKRLGRVIRVTSSPFSHHSRINHILTGLYARNYYLMESDALTSADKRYFESVREDMGDVEAAMALQKLSEYLFRHHGKQGIPHLLLRKAEAFRICVGSSCDHGQIIQIRKYGFLAHTGN